MRCTVKDRQRLIEILGHHDVLPFISDDGCNNIELAIDILSNSNCYVLMPNDNVAILAYPLNLISYDIHIAIHPNGRGIEGLAAFNDGIDWIFNNTSCEKLIMFCPSNNQRVIKFVKKCGFKQEGRLKRSFKKDDMKHDQLIMCRSK